MKIFGIRISQSLPDFFSSGVGVHGGVKGGAALAQGTIEFRQQKQQEKACGKGQFSV